MIRAVALLLLLLLPGLARAQEDVARVADPAVGRVLNMVSSTQLQGTGSGFVLTPVNEGRQVLFLTNHHVIAGARHLLIGFLQEGDVYFYEAKIVADDARRDLAALIFDAPGVAPETAGHRLSALAVRGQTARKGETVAALGFPAASDNLGTKPDDTDFYNSTITTGNASKILQQTWTQDKSRPFEIVQHTASINPGNSGGPLLDLCAQVVGLNTSVALDRRSGGNANDTYFASGSTTIIDFLTENGLPYQPGTQDCAGPEARPAPQPAPAPAPAPVPVRGTPIWAIAAICFVLAAGLIGGIVAFARREKGAAAPAARAGAVLMLRLGGSAPVPCTAADLARGLRIGRAPEADIRFDASGVSRIHALLRLSGRRLTLTDLGSTNGTRVDGRVLSPNVPVQIASRSKILLGSEALVISRPGGGR